jgi:hypothetical protein
MDVTAQGNQNLISCLIGREGEIDNGKEKEPYRHRKISA